MNATAIPSDTVSERRKLLIISTVTISILSFYLGAIFFLRETFLGFEFRLGSLALLTFGSVALATLFCFALYRYATNYVSVAVDVHKSALVTLLLFIALDIGYSEIQNATKLRSNIPGYGRGKDPNYLVGEFYPRLYFPTVRNFALQKPNFTVTASSFGDLYWSGMLNSPTLLNSVLELRTVSIEINNFGFREVEPIENARVFALGDSFVFGPAVNADKSWVKTLEHLLSTPIYNLGVCNASPKQELELLKFLLSQGPSIKINHLLWMIYEGNDLEDSYDENASDESILPESDTVFAILKRLPDALKRQSVITKLLNGSREFRYSAKTTDYSSRKTIDGIDIGYPLFQSDKFGYKLFYDVYIGRAQMPRSYVLLHPNWPKLENVFKEMGELARSFGFDVTVILLQQLIGFRENTSTDFLRRAMNHSF
jgi:hypothetical protein